MSEQDGFAWTWHPSEERERSFERVADWGPAEDWADWADAAR
jgi:hypothetical protein